MFFSLDGADGGGKTTQLRLFCEWLRSSGYDVVSCRDPGSTRLGDCIRHIVLEGDGFAGGGVPIARRSEMLLYMAARAQLVEEVIAPALSAGKTVVSDRFLLSNIVYQGYAGGFDVETIRRVGAIATAGVEPTLTFVLDAPEEVAAARMNRPLDRMERQGDEFRAALRAGYLAEAARSPDKIVVIDASRSIDAVQTDLRAVASRVLTCR